jgi:zinc protease
MNRRTMLTTAATLYFGILALAISADAAPQARPPGGSRPRSQADSHTGSQAGSHAGARTGSHANPQIVTLPGSPPLVEVRVMLRAGSAHDPAGKEGLAALTANALLEGGYGDPAKPVTKDELARITRRWGENAKPSVLLDKETTTFVFNVPREVLAEYRQTVLEPLFTRPLFLKEEIDRLRNEAVTNLTASLRYEDIEILGLEALDDDVFSGTSRGHTVTGSVQGLRTITPDDVRSFYVTYYKTPNMILGLSSDDAPVIDTVRAALATLGTAPKGGKARTLKAARLAPPAVVSGRELTIVGLPDAPAASLHAGFPIEVRRDHPDFWPLYVANVYFGTHRDDHGVLYQHIREQRGYNYGDYSYIEHFAFRPYALFPPFNTPREQQYFSIWIRPVAEQYTHHILKALTWELENLWRNGIPPEAVELSKNKAKVLYLNLAETSSRLLAAKMDDAYYGTQPGYLQSYLTHIDAVTPEQVNAAVRRHLRPDNIKYLIVEKMEKARALANDIRLDRNTAGKTPEEYQISSAEQDGQRVYDIPEARLHVLQQDAVWASTRLGIDPQRIRVVPVEALFETGAFITEGVAAGGAAATASAAGPR